MADRATVDRGALDRAIIDRPEMPQTETGYWRDPDRRWALVFGVVVMLLTSLPYLLGYGTQDETARFTGFVLGVEDGNSYIAKMHSGAAGAWLFRTPYTATEQRGALMFLPYLVLGKLAASPAVHLQFTALYHLFRFGAGMLAILASYDFLAFFITERRWRRFGLALAALGGGLGWVLVIFGATDWLGSLPLDFYSPESFGFLSLFALPHLCMARATLFWSALLYLRQVQGDDADGPAWRTAALLSALWLISGLFQPLVVLVIGFAIVLHLAGMAVLLFWRRQQGEAADWGRWWELARLVIAAGVLPGAFVLFNLWQVWSDPFLGAWTAQNLIRSPHPLHYLLAYGLMLPFAWVGGRRLVSRYPWAGWLPVLWVISLPLLAYAPVNLQRRLPEGIWIAWVVLALAALDERGGATAPRRSRSAWALALAFPSTLFLFAGGLLTARQIAPPLFRPEGEVQVFEFLAESAAPGEVVLTAFKTGNPLPAWAPLRVVIGHGPESVGLADLEVEVVAFFSSSTDADWRLVFLQRQDVTYVLWGPEERALGDWDPHEAGYLIPKFQVGAYELFVVHLDGR